MDMVEVEERLRQIIARMYRPQTPLGDALRQLLADIERARICGAMVAR